MEAWFFKEPTTLSEVLERIPENPGVVLRSNSLETVSELATMAAERVYYNRPEVAGSEGRLSCLDRAVDYNLDLFGWTGMWHYRVLECLKSLKFFDMRLHYHGPRMFRKKINQLDRGERYDDSKVSRVPQYANDDQQDTYESLDSQRHRAEKEKRRLMPWLAVEDDNSTPQWWHVGRLSMIFNDERVATKIGRFDPEESGSSGAGVVMVHHWLLAYLAYRPHLMGGELQAFVDLIKSQAKARAPEPVDEDWPRQVYLFTLARHHIGERDFFHYFPLAKEKG